MYKLKSLEEERNPIGRVFWVRSPIEAPRPTKDFVRVLGREVEIDGNVYEIKGVECYCQISDIKVGELGGL